MYKTEYHKEKLDDKAFLVTGGAGFIGSHIVEYLLKYGAKHVRVMDNLSTGSEDNVALFSKNGAYEFMKADICDPAACEKACSGIDYVFHQAALGSIPRSIKDPAATNQSNITGFLNVLLAARNNEIRRLVYASSSSVFGDNVTMPKTENQLGNPLSPYAVTKRVNELYAGVFSSVYGMELIGLRYFNIFGPRQRPDGPYAAAIPLFIQALLTGKPITVYGNGKQSRDFTFVENAVQANILAMFTDNPAALGEVFNIAIGEQITINHLLEYLFEMADNETEIIYQEERPGDIRHSMASIAKARKELGYNPAIYAKEGLAATYGWFRENLPHQ